MPIESAVQDVPTAIAHVLAKEPRLTISSLGEFARVTCPARRSISLHPPYDSVLVPEEQGIRFRLSSSLKDVLSAGPDSTAAKRFELALAQGSVTYECARGVATQLSCSEEQAQGAIRDWVSSLVKQLQVLETRGLVAVPPLGFFEVRRYQGYAGMNPITKQPIPIPPSVLAFFIPSLRLRRTVNGRPLPEEVSHEECNSVCGSILEMEDYTTARVLDLVSSVKAHKPGISAVDLEHIQATIGGQLPTLLGELLRNFSINHPPFRRLSTIASTPQAFAALIERYGDPDEPRLRAIPFAEVSDAGECAWFVCACSKCSDDPQVFAAQQVGQSGHEDEGDAMRLSMWISSRVLLHRAITTFEGRVLPYDDAIVVMKHLAQIHAGEGVNPNLPI